MLRGTDGGSSISSGGSTGRLVPGPQAEQGQPDPGEDPAGLDPAGTRGRTRRPAACGGVGRVAGQPEGDVGLDGGRQVGGAAVEGGPRAVVALVGPDPPWPSAAVWSLGADAEELAQQQVLGVHGDVGLELALPPAVGVLPASQGAAARSRAWRRRRAAGPRRPPSVGDVVDDGGHRSRSVTKWAMAGQLGRGPGSRSARSSAANAAVQVRLGDVGGLVAGATLLDSRAASATSCSARRPEQERLELGAPTVGPGQRGDDGQGLLVLDQVAADRLAGDGRARPRCRARRRRPGRRSRRGGRSRRGPRRSRRGPRRGRRRATTAQDSRAPVLPSSMRRHSSTVTDARVSKAMSSAWPAIISWVASARAAAARTRSGVGSRAAPGWPGRPARRRR